MSKLMSRMAKMEESMEGLQADNALLKETVTGLQHNDAILMDLKQGGKHLGCQLAGHEVLGPNKCIAVNTCNPVPGATNFK